MYKKEYEQVSESKDENWRKKHNYMNLKKFKDYESRVKGEETDK